MAHWKRRSILETTIFRFYVKLWGVYAFCHRLFFSKWGQRKTRPCICCWCNGFIGIMVKRPLAPDFRWLVAARFFVVAWNLRGILSFFEKSWKLHIKFLVCSKISIKTTKTYKNIQKPTDFWGAQRGETSQKMGVGKNLTWNLTPDASAALVNSISTDDRWGAWRCWRLRACWMSGRWGSGRSSGLGGMPKPWN